MKQVIVVRSDLKLPKGKLAAQVAHGSVEAALRSQPSVLQEWRQTGAKKVVLKVKSEKELVEVFQDAKRANLPAKLISDAGHTVVKPGTKTVVGIGPAPQPEVDSVTGDLKLL